MQLLDQNFLRWHTSWAFPCRTLSEKENSENSGKPAPSYYNANAGSSAKILAQLQEDSRIKLEPISPAAMEEVCIRTVKQREKRLLVGGGDGTRALSEHTLSLSAVFNSCRTVSLIAGNNSCRLSQVLKIQTWPAKLVREGGYKRKDILKAN